MTALQKQTSTIRALLDGKAMKEQFSRALPAICKPEHFVRVALTAINKTPKLAQCTQESLLGCLMDCAQFGLPPDGRRAYLIPYGQQATLIIGYQGLIELARRSGELSMWKAELVCENDEFSYSNGEVTHSINFREPRGNVYAVYSVAKFKDGTYDYEIMTHEEIEAIRKRSKSGSNGPWVTDFNEMAKKTVIRRHAKRMPLSSEFHDALGKDEDQLAQPMKQAEGVSKEVVDALRRQPAEVQPEPEAIEAEVAGDEVPQ